MRPSHHKPAEPKTPKSTPKTGAIRHPHDLPDRDAEIDVDDAQIEEPKDGVFEHGTGGRGKNGKA